MLINIFAKHKNRKINSEIYASLIHRASDMFSRPARDAIDEIIKCSAYLITQIYDNDDEVMAYAPKNVGNISYKQFIELYHVTIWALAAIYASNPGINRDGEIVSNKDWNIISLVVTDFIGEKNKYDNINEWVDNAAQSQLGPLFGTKLYESYSRILKYPENAKCSCFPLIISLTSISQRL